MVAEKKKRICRPDEQHFCVECCKNAGGGRGTPCILLGEVKKGIKGCLAEKKEYEGLKMREICREDCVYHFDDFGREIIQKIIKEFSAGEFKMSNVLVIYNEGKDIAKQLGDGFKYIGPQMGLNGEIGFHCFLDEMSSSNFCGSNLEGAKDGLRELRREYNLPLPEFD
jgi:hypothetical protein